MKRLLLPFLLVAMLTAPAFAQDPASSEDDPAATTSASNGLLDLRHRGGRGGGGSGGGGNDRPVAPVPEPGTMALASMGLIALGAAARKRRGK